jgi:transcriptional regulator with GAF, ATPase, and Fis domain
MSLLETHTQLDTEKETGSLGTTTRLLVFDSTGARKIALPHAGALVIGRGDEADVRIDHPRVSRLHARLVLGDSVSIEDLGSANGTRLDGVALAPERPVNLCPGVPVTIANALLMLEGERGLSTTPWVPTELDAVTLRIARSNISVIVHGETGVGKEVLAEKLHLASLRKDGPLVRLNCAALPETLLESELFGHERGAFTGAVRSKPGLFEWGDQGTLFLDEIGELTLATQAKLLRVLENGEITRVGGLRPKRIDVRVLCATHRDLPGLVERGAFRHDLYFRLNGVTLFVAPLRERRDEILPLARRFLAEAAELNGVDVPFVTRSAEKKLLAHDWPGNVRELKNAMTRALVLAGDQPLMPEHLAPGGTVSPPSSLRRTTPPASGLHIKDEVMALERQRILEALERAGGNQTEAARLLDMPRRTLICRLDQYGIARPRKRVR